MLVTGPLPVRRRWFACLSVRGTQLIRSALWGGECLAELDDFVQRIAKVFEARQGDNDGVVTTIDLLDDSQEPTPRILSQVKREMLALDPNAVIL
jgi:hypothetical protein